MTSERQTELLTPTPMANRQGAGSERVGGTGRLLRTNKRTNQKINYFGHRSQAGHKPTREDAESQTRLHGGHGTGHGRGQLHLTIPTWTGWGGRPAGAGGQSNCDNCTTESYNGLRAERTSLRPRGLLSVLVVHAVVCIPAVAALCRRVRGGGTAVTLARTRGAVIRL